MKIFLETAWPWVVEHNNYTRFNIMVYISPAPGSDLADGIVRGHCTVTVRGNTQFRTD